MIGKERNIEAAEATIYQIQPNPERRSTRCALYAECSFGNILP